MSHCQCCNGRRRSWNMPICWIWQHSKMILIGGWLLCAFLPFLATQRLVHGQQSRSTQSLVRLLNVTGKRTRDGDLWQNKWDLGLWESKIQWRRFPTIHPDWQCTLRDNPGGWTSIIWWNPNWARQTFASRQKARQLLNLWMARVSHMERFSDKTMRFIGFILKLSTSTSLDLILNWSAKNGIKANTECVGEFTVASVKTGAKGLIIFHANKKGSHCRMARLE